MGKPPEEIKYERKIEELEEEDEVEEQVFLTQRKYNHEEKKIDLGYQTCTEQKTSRRVIFPPERPVKEEATLEVRLEMWREELDKYMKSNCDERGTQKVTQLTKAQENGKKKLLRRVLKGEIHISPADKGNSIVVMPLSMYQKMVRTHSNKDQKVEWQRLEEAQKQVRSHTRGLAKVFKVGANKGDRNQTRCHSNLSSWACNPPILRATAKTHKKIGEGGPSLKTNRWCKQGSDHTPRRDIV